MLMFCPRIVRRTAAATAFVWLLAPGLLCAASESEKQRAQALVNAAIRQTDSEQALKQLWQATDIDPTFEESYVYLGMFYQSREQFSEVARVYKKLVKYRPSVNGYCNVGEADLGLRPPNYDEALKYFRRAYSLDPQSARVALRIGQILTIKGNRAEARRFLKQASEDPEDVEFASEAKRELGAF
jgi:tetratricopeptide (TPR) repeat protein